MSVPDGDVFQRLRGHHLGALSDDVRQIALKRLAGQPVESIAEELARSPGAIRHEITRLQDAIFIPLCLERDQWATAFWVAVHLECCVADAR